MLMMMDTHFSRKEETRKIKTGRKREKETRARDVKILCSFARRRKEWCAFISNIRTFFMRHFERNLGEKRDSWLHDEEFTVARSNQERRVCFLFS
jgi:hypothetical protein